MSDGQVTVTLSIQDAAAMLGWRRQRKGADDLTAGIGNAKKAYSSLNTAQRASWDQLSAMGAKALQSQSAWGKGLAELTRQNDQAKASANWDAMFTANETRAGTTAKKMGGAFTSALGKVKKGVEGLIPPMDGFVARWASVGTAVGLVATSMQKITSAMQEVRAEQAQATFPLDERFRGFQTQAQLTDEQMGEYKAHQFEVAKKYAVPVEQVIEAEKQLVSSGFAPEEVKRGAGESFIKGKRGSPGQGGENVTELAQASTMFLMAQSGLEEGEQKSLSKTDAAALLTTEKLERLEREGHALYLSHNFQTQDLTQLAKAAPVLAKAGMGVTEQLAAYTALRDVYEAPEAAIGLRNVAQRMMTAGGSDMKVEQLASIGLKPEDIDLVGESLPEALDRIKAALSNVSAERQAIFTKKIFEEEGSAYANQLLKDPDKIRRYAKEAKQVEKLDTSVARATTGPAAAKQRLETEQQEQRFGGEGAMDELIAKAIENFDPESPVMGKLNAMAYKAARKVGLSQGAALAGSVPTGTPDEWLKAAKENPFELIRRIKEAQAPAKGETAAKAPEAPAEAEPADQTDWKAVTEQRAREYQDEEVRKENEKLLKKVNAEAVKLLKAGKAAADKAIKKATADAKHLQSQADTAGRSAATQRDHAAADQRQIEEIKKRIAFKQQQNSRQATTSRQAGASHVASPAPGKHGHGGGSHHAASHAPREKTEKQKASEAEEIRRLRAQLTEQERQKAEHEKKASELMEKQNALLDQIAKNTAGQGKQPPRPPQRAPANIGGN